MARTLFDRVWDRHVVREVEGEPTLIYIDLHLLHEVTSPQAFEGLRLADRVLRLVEDGAVVATDGSVIELQCETICVHGDTPGAGELAAEIRSSLEKASIRVLPISAID